MQGWYTKDTERNIHKEGDMVHVMTRAICTISIKNLENFHLNSLWQDYFEIEFKLKNELVIRCEQENIFWRENGVSGHVVS